MELSNLCEFQKKRGEEKTDKSCKFILHSDPECEMQIKQMHHQNVQWIIHGWNENSSLVNRRPGSICYHNFTSHDQHCGGDRPVYSKMVPWVWNSSLPSSHVEECWKISLMGFSGSSSIMISWYRQSELQNAFSPLSEHCVFSFIKKNI